MQKIKYIINYMSYFNWYHLLSRTGILIITRFNAIYLLDAYISKKNILSLNLICELSALPVFCANPTKDCVNVISHAACECRDTMINYYLYVYSQRQSSIIPIDPAAPRYIQTAEDNHFFYFIFFIFMALTQSIRLCAR